MKKIFIYYVVLVIITMGVLKIVHNYQSTVSNVAGIWSDLKKSGLEYERKIREGWKKRKIE